MKKNKQKQLFIMLLITILLNNKINGQIKINHVFQIDSSLKINQNLELSFDLDSKCNLINNTEHNKFFFEDSSNSYIISIFSRSDFVNEYFYHKKNKKWILNLENKKFFKLFVKGAIHLYDTSNLKPIVYIDYNEQIFYSVNYFNDSIIFPSPAVRFFNNSSFLVFVLIKKKNSLVGDINKYSTNLEILKTVTINRKKL